MTPILYSFRRCPYAIRARLAIAQAGIRVQLREVVLRDKPDAFLKVSPSATVPCLVTDMGAVDESRDIMIWALEQNDPEGWLNMPKEGWRLIEDCEGPFKHALDRTKYHTRYPDEDRDGHRAAALSYLKELDAQLDDWLFGRQTLADYAILPFVRQFAFIDKDWFDAQDLPNLAPWLERFLASDCFAKVMQKHKQWHPGDEVVSFPA
ncbi:MAG: glutathione S-transferase [Maritimibacter sp.]